MRLLFLYWRFRRRDRQLRMQPVAEDDYDDSSELDAFVPILLSKKKFIHSRFRKTFYNLLSRAERRRRVKKIPRGSLQLPLESAWSTLYQGKSDAAMITLTGLDFAVFHDLHLKFKPFFDKLTPHVKNGERKLILRCLVLLYNYRANKVGINQI